MIRRYSEPAIDERWLMRHGSIDLVLWADSMINQPIRGKHYTKWVVFSSNTVSGEIR